ncbi:MAG: hypothetical protein AB2404_01400 [Planifilum fimeticola]|jgi:uncharacterized membrane protein YkvI
MRINLGQSFRISMTIVGTTIGAGFASGREIWEFFGSYGEEGRYGIFLSMALYFAASVIILHIGWKKRTHHYSEVLQEVIGPKLARYFDGFVILSLLTGVLVMVAGSGATLEQWNGSFTLGTLLMAVAVVLVLFFDLRGIMSLNTLLMPALTVILILVCFQALGSGGETAGLVDMEPENSLFPVWPSAITYAAFNMISLLAVLSTMGSQIRHPAEIWIACLLGASCLAVIAGLYNASLLKVSHLISQYNIPLFALIRDYSTTWNLIISLVLWFAIYTTAVSNMHGLVFRVADRLPYPRWAVGLVIMAALVPLSQWGFVPLVQFLYPLYGVLNLFLFTLFLLYPFSEER